MNRFASSVSAEFRKVTATKTWWVLAIVIAVYAAMTGGFFAFAFGAVSDLAGGPLPPQLDLTGMIYSSVTSFAYVIPLLLGAILATSEMRHNTLGLAFVAEPRRGLVLGTKNLVLLLFGALLGLAGLVGSVSAGAAILAASDIDPALDSGDTWSLFARVVLASALWAVIGFGVGLLVRSQAFAIVIALVFTQFLEPALRTGAQFWEWSANIAKFLPGAAADAFVGSSLLNSMSSLDPTMPEAAGGPLGMGAGLAVFAAYAVVLLLLGWLLRWRADIKA